MADTESVKHDLCGICNHAFGPHIVVATVFLDDDASTPVGGHIYCHRSDCDCHSTWSAPDDVAGFDVKARIEPLDAEQHAELKEMAIRVKTRSIRATDGNREEL